MSEVLVDWVTQVTGLPVESLTAIPGGGSRSSYVVSMRDGSKYLLRRDNGEGPLSGTLFTIGREFRVLSALKAAGCAVPGILHFSADLNAMLMEFVEGKTSYQIQLSAARQSAVQRDLLKQVARVHALDVSALGLPEFADLLTVGAALEQDLSTLRTLYHGQPLAKDPAIEFALNWLSAHIPDRDKRAALVHGDVGPGNFLFSEEDGRVLAVIDWEVVHVGHPLEDLAAVLCRALGVSFGSAEEHIANYEQLTNEPVDRITLDYMIVLVLTRWYIGLNLALARPAVSQNVPVLTTYRQSVARNLLHTLARRHGVSIPRADSATGIRPDTFFVQDYVIDTLRQLVLPAMTDPFLADRVSGLINLSLYVRSLMAYGPQRYMLEEQDDIEQLTGDEFSTPDEAVNAACILAAEVSADRAEPVLAYLLASTERRQNLWADAMGSMAPRLLSY